MMTGAMPTHACIFCPKSYSRLSQPPSELPRSDVTPSKNHLTAVPIFRGRVSPVLDTCTQLRFVESGSRLTATQKTVTFKGNTIFERAAEIKKLGIGLIICGALSDAFYNLLRQADIDLTCGITGNIDEVIEAHRNGTLAQARFRMPGSE